MENAKKISTFNFRGVLIHMAPWPLRTTVTPDPVQIVQKISNIFVQELEIPYNMVYKLLKFCYPFDLRNCVTKGPKKGLKGLLQTKISKKK